MSSKRIRVFRGFLAVIFLLGLAVVLYPAVSDYVNSRHQSRAIENYREAAGDLKNTDYSAWFDQADDYNKRLRETEYAFYDPKRVKGYEDTLNLNGSHIMGYITIPSIDVQIPIYHGTSPEVLNAAAGHMEGTSFPVGGPGNHAVISAHRGLPEAKLFTELDALKKGDRFTITILKRKLVYVVDQIYVAEPSESDPLQPVKNRDLCTLMTCTPYGVNSHRLLVRGERGLNSDKGPLAGSMKETLEN